MERARKREGGQAHVRSVDRPIGYVRHALLDQVPHLLVDLALYGAKLPVILDRKLIVTGTIAIM